jgi:uncharacterized protein (TIGR00251 family)
MTPKCIEVRVQPNASRNRIVEDDSGFLKVYVTTVPEDGKANKAVQELLAQFYKIAKSKVVLKKGQKDKNKIFEILD